MNWQYAQKLGSSTVLGLYFFVYKREMPNKHLMYIAILMGKCYTKAAKDKTSYKNK